MRLRIPESSLGQARRNDGGKCRGRIEVVGMTDLGRPWVVVYARTVVEVVIFGAMWASLPTG